MGEKLGKYDFYILATSMLNPCQSPLLYDQINNVIVLLFRKVNKDCFTILNLLNKDF